MPVVGSVLALDVGSKTIGLAGTDPLRMMAFPLHTVMRQSVVKDAAILAKVCQERKVSQLVVGLALELDGSEGRPVRLARQVADELVRLTGLPVDWEDERYSTMEAKERLRDAGVPEVEWKSLVDAQAAAVILEDWLERTRQAAAQGVS